MTEFIHVEPDRPHRPAFAVWGLSQSPPIQTATATGWDVPIGLYSSIPSDLLEGAHVDGYRVGGVGAPGTSAGAATTPAAAQDEDAEVRRHLARAAALDAVQDAAEGVPSATPTDGSADRTPRKRAATRRRTTNVALSGNATESGYTVAQLLGGDE